MPRKTSRYSLDTFLRQLARTGNFTLAADRAGLAKSGLYKRRARDPAFAQACESACKSSLSLLGRSRLPGSTGALAPVECRRREGDRPREGGDGGGARDGQSLKTTPGDLVLTHGQSRPTQIRRSPGGHLTRAGIETFLQALAETANVRLAASQVGIAHSSIYRRRASDPHFARAMKEALLAGYDKLEADLVECALRGLGGGEGDESGKAGARQALPPMNIDQAMTLLFLRKRQARENWDGMHSRESRVATEEEVERELRRALRRLGTNSTPTNPP